MKAKQMFLDYFVGKERKNYCLKNINFKFDGRILNISKSLNNKNVILSFPCMRVTGDEDGITVKSLVSCNVLDIIESGKKINSNNTFRSCSVRINV